MTVAALACPCGAGPYDKVFSYDAPPAGEVRFRFSGGAYKREVVRCRTCGHFLSRHGMGAGNLYEGDYVDSTYAEGLRKAFDRIIALDPAKSDNEGRVARVKAGAARWLAPGQWSILDVGAGLCVFLHRMKAEGWACTALDPDARAARHAQEVVGVSAVCGDFMKAEGLGSFDVISFNKVLEHVEDPVAMLARSARFLKDGGLIYVELPDGAAAAKDGPGREEFFIDHHHIFSAASLALLAARAGFIVRELESLREPSTKYTLRAFLARG